MPFENVALIGKPLDRTDGRLKITGQATYAADAPFPNLAHAVLVPCTIAKGRIQKLYTESARAALGVIAVLSHENAPKLTLPKENMNGGGRPAEKRLAFSDNIIHYVGQPIALVVAETFERAQHAASLITADYDVQTPELDRAAAEKSATFPAENFGEPLQHKRGDTTKALAEAPVKIEQTYITPIEHHNPMEISTTTASWNGDRLTVWDSTQWVAGTQATLAEAFNIPRENVHILCPFVGGGFGCKGFQWPHTFATAMAARQVNRPVKLHLSRRQMFTSTGHRPQTIQRLALGAARDGKLTAIRHEVVQETSFLADYVEACAFATSKFLYACPNADLPHKLIKLNLSTPNPMRAPGECPGSFALESAMDELAYALKIDPVQLRLINHADTDPSENRPFSSKHLKECYQLAADRFGWSSRKSEPRSIRNPQGQLVGWGMATCTYPARIMPASARIRLQPDGRAIVASSTQDLGTGSWTIFNQIAADALGLPLNRVTFQLGDSDLPHAPVSGGSNSSASVSQAIIQAATDLGKKLLKLAGKDSKSPLANVPPERIAFTNGRLVDSADPSHGMLLQELIRHAEPDDLEVTANSKPENEKKPYSFYSFGCHLVEVTVDEQLGHISVPRVVTVIDNGRVLNRKTANSQIIGGITMGIGMALLEETHYNADGRPINDNLADYPVCVNADIGSLDVQFIDIPDPHMNDLGCRGIGEIGIVGTAAAVANAVYHATGKRIRTLPITLDKLL